MSLQSQPIYPDETLIIEVQTQDDYLRSFALMDAEVAILRSGFRRLYRVSQVDVTTEDTRTRVRLELRRKG